MPTLSQTGSVLPQALGMVSSTAAIRPSTAAFARLRPRSPNANLAIPVLCNLAQQRSMASGSQYSSRHSTALTHTLHVQSTRNNVLLTFTDESGRKVFGTITGGSDKDFKKAHRSSYEAAHQAAIKMFGRIVEHSKGDSKIKGNRYASSGTGMMDLRLRVAFKGMFGKGREAVAAALTGPEGVEISPSVKVVEDRTPIKIGGTRPRKARRL